MKLLVLIAALALGIQYAGATNYEVGPGKPYTEIESVPWESLLPGDTVSIYWRPQAYLAKWVICRVGTQSNPIVVRGIPNGSGVRPVIDGREAVTRTQLNFWNEQRGVIKIGGANSPADTTPEHIIIEDLDIRSGRPGFYFTGRNGRTEYVNNCAAVYVEKGNHLTVRRCMLHDCGNGIFIGHLTENALIEYCSIFDNGIENSIYEHNTYTEAKGIVYQFNHFGSLRSGCLGNNLKDRSAGLVVRYNWIENGNRQLDLVDSDYQDLINDQSYRSTFVYGNILIEADGQGNSQMIHYGGDSGDETRYRKGTLYLYNNTIISTRSGNTTLVRMPTNDESCVARNNILYTTASGDKFAVISTDAGNMEFHNNAIKPGWVIAHGSTSGTLDARNTIETNTPGFADFANQDFHLLSNSVCVDTAMAMPAAVPAAHAVVSEYIVHTQSKLRAQDAVMDLGAYEYMIPTFIARPEAPEKPVLIVSPNPFSGSAIVAASAADRVDVVNSIGQVVAVLYEGVSQATGRSFLWTPDASVPAGLYFVRVNRGGVIAGAQLLYRK